MIAGEFPRVLAAAGPAAMASIKQLFSADPLDHWELVEAESFSQARFFMQHNSCAALLVHHELYEREGGQGLAWLAWQGETPIVLLAAPSPDQYQRAFELGVSLCVPEQMALEHPQLLIAAIEQAMSAGDTRLGLRRTRERLAECHRHVDRLVHMMWRSSQRQTDVQWFSQRSMLERLHEELARVERHQVPLTVAIGELAPAEEASEAPVLPDWASEMIAKAKRRCDVVGQYGPNGFMLLMVQTPIKGGLNCCRRLRNILEHPPEPSRTPPPKSLRAYFGLSSTAVNKTNPVALLRSAEQNLDAARADMLERIVVD